MTNLRINYKNILLKYSKTVRSHKLFHMLYVHRKHVSKTVTFLVLNFILKLYK